jgi:release factor glutamine methyltransferase
MEQGQKRRTETRMLRSTVKTILEEAAAKLAPSNTARRDAELLLMRVLGRDRAWLMAHGDAELTAEQAERFDAWVARRGRQEPVQYIVGEQEFYGLVFSVTPDVLIPRPETEHVVEAVLGKVPRDAAVRICDVGTGSGAIAIALAKELPRAEVTAVDCSAAALEVARQNGVLHGVGDRVRFVASDLLGAVRGERFDVVVSNPPYVAEGEALEAQVRDWEPHGALFAGETGLDVYRRLIPEAWSGLVRDGWLVMEMGQGQREAIAALLSSHQSSPGAEPKGGWEAVSFVADLQGIPRVAMARRGSGE